MCRCFLVLACSDLPGSERAKLPEISVAGDRGAQAIAKEIKRRFLPEYLPLLAKAIARRDEANTYEDKTRANLVYLAAIVGARVPDDRGRTTTHFSHGDIQVSGDSVTLKLSSLTVEQTKQILEMVKEGRYLMEYLAAERPNSKRLSFQGKHSEVCDLMCHILSFFDNKLRHSVSDFAGTFAKGLPC